MGTNANLATFVPGTTMASTAVNANLAAINTAQTFYYNTGSLSGLCLLSGTTSVPTNFTNPLGAAPTFAAGCTSSGFHLVCWDSNNSSASIIVVDPDSANGGAPWKILCLRY